MRRTRFNVRNAVLTILAFVTVLSCEKEAPEPVRVSGVNLNKTTLTLLEGTSETLTATVAPTDAENKAVTWTSSTTAVATVGDDGKVMAVKAGTATITVTTKDGEKKAECTVTVKAPVTSLAMAEDLTKFNIPDMVSGTKIADINLAGIITGGTPPYTYTATGLPAGLSLTEGKITGTPSKTGSEGTVKIMIKDSSEPQQTIEVPLTHGTISEAAPEVTSVTGITITSATTMVAGTPLTLAATVTPSDATNKTIAWTIKSAGTTGATISGSTLSATAAGTVTITATIVDGKAEGEDYTKDFTITVTASSVQVPAETMEITAPKGGEKPSMTISTAFDAKFTSKIDRWEDNDSETFTGTFVGKEIYWTYITLTADRGYTFKGYNKDNITGFKVNGITPTGVSVSNDGTTMSFFVRFTAEAADLIQVPAATMTLIVPKGGEKPSTTITPALTAKFTAKLVWEDNLKPVTGNFIGGEDYMAHITLTATAGYTFAGYNKNNTEDFKVNAKSPESAVDVSVSSDGKTMSFYVVFTAEHTYSISVLPASVDFGSITAGDPVPTAKTVEITNKGTISITLDDLKIVADYTLGTLSTKSLAPGAKATFTVQPKESLKVGTYNRTTSITGKGTDGKVVTPSTLNVAFKVIADDIENGGSDMEKW